MRLIGVALHRWLGLAAALFLLVAGATGAIISWDHELDEWLNPAMFKTDWQQGAQPALALADQLEAQRPELIVTFLPLQVEPGHALSLFVDARGAQAGTTPEALGYNQLALHPVSGHIQGQRQWGAASLSRENLMPFLYKLHYSLHLPDWGGYETGVLLMGVIGIIWTLDCFIALWIAFPSRRSWQKSFSFRWNKGRYKRYFDLHRSGGVWLWGLLLILAFTSVSMNLDRQVVRPLVNMVSPLTASPFESQPFQAHSQPRISRQEVVSLALNQARAKGIEAPLGGLFYSPDFDVYGVGFFTAGKSHGDGGLGNPWLYYNGSAGEYLGADIPGRGSAGDIFMQAQFPLHSGRIFGLPGRILVSVLGAAVAILSFTGIWIWAQKRTSRRKARHRNQGYNTAPAPKPDTQATALKQGHSLNGIQVIQKVN